MTTFQLCLCKSVRFHASSSKRLKQGTFFQVPVVSATFWNSFYYSFLKPNIISDRSYTWFPHFSTILKSRQSSVYSSSLISSSQEQFIALLKHFTHLVLLLRKSSNTSVLANTRREHKPVRNNAVAVKKGEESPERVFKLQFLGPSPSVWFIKYGVWLDNFHL